ncbi:3-dehydroquinate synthase [Paludibacterium denitrificans]|uniref:3-dehydroquinate synthase n=1 Tax=Paludibacterium denitrificans TaxID=2675226 RepID=A0A844GF39_9NEIS|nr:3-dehydroquinate synthase [Paludibacterium denitrificans]MTD33324.1 3-dehydroquinate synthase [Paludibacterium denitrificans]
MITLDLTLPDTRYPIHIGRGLLDQVELLLPHLPIPKVAIVTNTVVAPLYLVRLQKKLAEHDVEVTPIILPDGEDHKTPGNTESHFRRTAAWSLRTKNYADCPRGGVIGDMTGFAAACYQRGAPFIQIPTTLLAQVDSSVGGKTAINHPLGKNMIGAFYQPKVVIADTELLATLPTRELSAGLAEVIKYGLLGDASFLSWLEEHMEALLAQDPDALQYAIRRSCEMKANIVQQDEKESGIRALLNLGHTFGHAIETGLGYGAWLHGEAVAAGMVLAAAASAAMGWITADDVLRVETLISRAGLPIKSPDLGVAQWLELMGHDKKVESGTIRYVLLKALGHAIIQPGLPKSVMTKLLTGRHIIATEQSARQS